MTIEGTGEEGVKKHKIGTETVVEINDSRYKLPIILSGGIYNILASIARDSLTTYKERKEASEKYYDALVKAREEREMKLEETKKVTTEKAKKKRA